MRIKKIDQTFNDYKVEMSFGQLVAIRNALEKDHSDPLSDEIYGEIQYYLQNVPGPGEEQEDFDAERDAAKKTKDEAGEEVEGGEAPSTDTELEAGNKLPPPPSGEEEGEMGAFVGTTDEDGGEAPEGEEGAPRGVNQGPKLSPEEREVIDQAMPQGKSRLLAPPEE